MADDLNLNSAGDASDNSTDWMATAGKILGIGAEVYQEAVAIQDNPATNVPPVGAAQAPSKAAAAAAAATTNYTPWIIGGVVVLAVVMFAMRRK